MKIARILVASLIAFGVSALAMPPPATQTQGSYPNQAIQQHTTMTVEPMDQTPTFRVTVISRTVQAVNYSHRSGATKLGFKGTELMPGAHAEAKVDLAEQGIPGSSMTAAGFGKTRPIAPNDTAEGRQQNRRVELVVSGEVIGTTIGELRMQPTTLSQPR